MPQNDDDTAGVSPSTMATLLTEWIRSTRSLDHAELINELRLSTNGEEAFKEVLDELA